MQNYVSFDPFPTNSTILKTVFYTLKRHLRENLVYLKRHTTLLILLEVCQGDKSISQSFALVTLHIHENFEHSISGQLRNHSYEQTELSSPYGFALFENLVVRKREGTQGDLECVRRSGNTGEGLGRGVENQPRHNKNHTEISSTGWKAHAELL